MFALAVGPHCGHSVAPISAYPRIVPPKGSGDNRNSDRGDDSGYCGPGYPANGERTVFILRERPCRRGAEFRGCGRRKFHTIFQLEMLKFFKVDQNRTKIEPKQRQRS